MGADDILVFSVRLLRESHVGLGFDELIQMLDIPSGPPGVQFGPGVAGIRADERCRLEGSLGQVMHISTVGEV